MCDTGVDQLKWEDWGTRIEASYKEILLACTFHLPACI